MANPRKNVKKKEPLLNAGVLSNIATRILFLISLF
jgi:hypothetical protein